MITQHFQILRENKNVLTLIGEGKSPDTGRIHGSRFNFFVKVDDGTLVYNTLTNSFVFAKDDVVHFLYHETIVPYNRHDLPEDFFRLRLVVPEDFDELGFYRQCHALLIQLRNLRTGGIRYNIYTTTACNARCFYCFEEGIAQEHMSNETAEAVARYIVKNHSPTEEIHLRWFGGEPLLNPKAISTICDYCRAQGVRFYSTMSTNGWLLERNMLKMAKTRWCLAKVRFSFDGTREEHNRRKAFIPQGDGFSRTLDNLRCTIDMGIHVVIRLTLDVDNADSLRELAEEFVEEFQNNPYVTIYAKCIGQETSKAAYLKDQTRTLNTIKLQDDLNTWLHDRGKFDTERIMPAGLRIGNCTANDPRKVVISPTGRLSSCECFCTPANQWGDVWNGITNEQVWRFWTFPKSIREQCATCSLLPVCTPFAADCLWDMFDCRARFEPTMSLFMRENYRRHLSGEPMLPDTEDFSRFSFVVFESNRVRKEVNKHEEIREADAPHRQG